MAIVTITTETARRALEALRAAGAQEDDPHFIELESVIAAQNPPEETFGEQYGKQAGETKTPEDYAHLLPHDLVVEGSTEPEDG